jgi:hypothetical protein
VQDILKSAETMRKSMNPPSPLKHSAAPVVNSSVRSPAYLASFLNPQHRPDSPNLRVAAPPLHVLQFDDSPLFAEDTNFQEDQVLGSKHSPAS